MILGGGYDLDAMNCRSLLSIAALPLFGQSPAIVAGTVQGEVSQTIPNAIVWLVPRPPFSGSIPQAQRVVTGLDGTFSFSTPAGSYEVCASAVSADYMDSCAWTNTPGKGVFAVSAGQKLVLASIKLEKGGRVRVSFIDPAGLLKQSEPRPHTRMLVKIGVPGMGFAMMPVVEDTGARRSYEMLVPRQRGVRLRIVSDVFDLADDQNKAVAIANGHDRDVVVPANGALPPISFRVAALRGH